MASSRCGRIRRWRPCSRVTSPVMNIEPCYEDHVAGTTQLRFNAYKVRVACYWSMLSAPAAGLTYGAHVCGRGTSARRFHS
ncbi:MAG TPA: DUF4038 domain-containing protein, partial [Candidatus Handelsmanbacteria bacterium]|nr:DUF4038 domain-containing protein [Candidatus Handelsmanbacteria bacterium]